MGLNARCAKASIGALVVVITFHCIFKVVVLKDLSCLAHRLHLGTCSMLMIMYLFALPFYFL